MINFTWLAEKLKKLATPTTNFIKNVTDFSWLAKVSTAKRPIFYGLLPSFTAIVTIFAISALLAGGMWLWTAATMTASAASLSFLPFLGEAMVGMLGLTFLNFWFNREINTFLLSSRDVLDDFTFMKNKNPTDLRKMVEHIRQELNVYFKNLYGDKHQDLPMPRICTFTETNFQIVTIEGRNPGRSALFISSGALNYSVTKMNQRHLAALLQMELVKIYLRRGVTRTMAGMAADLLTNLKNISGASVLGVLAGPLNFFILLERSLKRSYEYEAAEIVIECGRGPDLIDAIDKKICPPLDIKPTYLEVRAQQAKYKRAVFTGFFQKIIRPFTNWIDKNEPITDDKSGYRLFTLFDTLVRELGYYVRELWSSNPRATRLKDHLKKLIKDPTLSDATRQFDLDSVHSHELQQLHAHSRELNRHLYDNIPEESRYAPIGPDAEGKVPGEKNQSSQVQALEIHALTVQYHILESKMAELLERLQGSSQVSDEALLSDSFLNLDGLQQGANDSTVDIPQTAQAEPETARQAGLFRPN